MRSSLCVYAAIASIASASSVASAAALFTDDFSTVASAANYTQLESSADTAVTHAFDYSTMGIPAAPNTTDASTLGVKFEANIQDEANSAVTLHTVQQFTGSYVVKFDAWINVNGPLPGGGAGSTEFLTAGVGGDGATLNMGSISGSGAWTAVDGEGGSGRDYRIYKDGTEQFAESGQLEAGTSSEGGGAHNHTDPYYAGFGSINVADLPVQGANNSGPAQQTGTSAAGTFGFAWHEVELRVDPNGGTGSATSMEWRIDGLTIATLDAGIGSAFSTDGSATIGYNDRFPSVSDNANLSFGLVDNLTVVPEPASLALASLALIAMLCIAGRPE